MTIIEVKEDAKKRSRSSFGKKKNLQMLRDLDAKKKEDK